MVAHTSRVCGVQVVPHGKPIGDPDLYLTNRNAGAGPLSREAFVWKSTNVGSDRIDVHPDDPAAAAGSTYLVGVLGYADRNRWKLSYVRSMCMRVQRWRACVA